METIALSDKWIAMLLAKPETGMGYQVVSIKLKDGREFKQVVIDSGYITRIRSLKNIPFDESEIDEIIVTHDKWDWQKE